MTNYAYNPTNDEKKVCVNKARKLVVILLEMSMEQEQIEEIVTRAINAYLSEKHGETVYTTFQFNMDMCDIIYKWVRSYKDEQ